MKAKQKLNNFKLKLIRILTNLLNKVTINSEGSDEGCKYQHRDVGVFAHSLGDWGSILGQVTPKTQKVVLDATLLNIL